jgi:hypothetical protein
MTNELVNQCLTKGENKKEVITLTTSQAYDG